MSVASPIVSTRTGQTHDARTHDDSTRHAYAHRYTARVRGLPGSVIRREDLTLSVECRRGDGCSGYLGDARPDLTGVRPEGGQSSNENPHTPIDDVNHDGVL